MAEKLNVDLGVIEFVIGKGSLCFNPSNPRVYQRFAALLDELPAIEEKYGKKELEKEKLEKMSELERAHLILDEMDAIDQELCARLDETFGPGNDLKKVLGDESLMGFGCNGERVITNLLNALLPYMKSGSEKHMKDQAAEAVAEAKQNRAQRRAKK